MLNIYSTKNLYVVQLARITDFSYNFSNTSTTRDYEVLNGFYIAKKVDDNTTFYPFKENVFELLAHNGKRLCDNIEITEKVGEMFIYNKAPLSFYLRADKKSITLKEIKQLELKSKMQTEPKKHNEIAL